MPDKKDPVWTKEVKRVYQKYPAAIRSENWPEIVGLANSGHIDQAMAMAKDHQESSKKIKAENITARRLRIERMALFSRLATAEREARSMFHGIGSSLEKRLSNINPTAAGLEKGSGIIHEAMLDLRKELRKWISSIVRDSLKMSFRNAGKAFEPIFRANRESFDEDIVEHQLIEEALEFGVKTSLAANAEPIVNLSAKKWKNVIKRLRTLQLKGNMLGVKPSEQVWELTTRTEAQLKRILANGISTGRPARKVSQDIRKFLQPNILKKELAGPTSPGVYKSPFKNAMRMARTEANKAYTNASAEWAKNKSWITGVRITLSPQHSQTDICDSFAGQVVTPERFQELVPFHPHCLCHSTYVIDEGALEEAALPI